MANTEAWVETVQALTDEVERLRDARALAYGLLWHMRVDRRDPNDDLACRAREVLLVSMDKPAQAYGIEIARDQIAQMRGEG